MNTAERQGIELSIKQAKETLEMGKAFERLLVNRDFRKIIIEGYFEQEAIRLVHLKADTNMQGAEQQKSIIQQMDAVGALNAYLTTLQYRVNMAKKSLESDEQMLEELLAEGL